MDWSFTLVFELPTDLRQLLDNGMPPREWLFSVAPALNVDNREAILYDHRLQRKRDEARFEVSVQYRVLVVLPPKSAFRSSPGDTNPSRAVQ
jgi:hypothetical protein